MKLALIVLAALGGAASAAPLAAKWRVAGCPDLLSRRTPTELVAVDRKAKTIVRRDLATGAMLKALPLAVKGKDVYLAETTGDTLVLRNTGSFIGVDAATGKQRWTTKAGKALRLDDDLAIATESKGVVTVQRLVGKTGVKAWSADVAGSGKLSSFAQDGTHVVVGFADDKAPAFTVAVVDAKTGAIAWTTKLAIKSYHGALVSTGAVVVEEPRRATTRARFTSSTSRPASSSPRSSTRTRSRRCSPATGCSLDSTISTSTPARSSRSTSRPASRSGPPRCRASSGASRASPPPASCTRATASSKSSTWRPASCADYGVPAREHLELGDRGGPLVTLCDGKETLALDLGGTGETAKVTGKIACAGCDTPPLPIRIGTTTGKTDDKGAFALTVTGAGRFEVILDLDANTIIASGKYVVLDGKGPYDLGTIKVAPPVLGD
jgi:hypothetical protein